MRQLMAYPAFIELLEYIEEKKKQSAQILVEEENIVRIYRAQGAKGALEDIAGFINEKAGIQ